MVASRKKRAPAASGSKSGRPPVTSRSKSLGKALSGLDGFSLWAEVPAPLICPTRITSFNRGMRCGGIPGGMLGVLHGPSQGGKTLLLAEFLRAAWASGGWGLFVDAECRGVDLAWFGTICANLDEVAYFKPQTYEEAIEKIEMFRAKFRAAKKSGDVPEGAFLAVGIDSVNRLTPGTELEELLKGKVNTRGYPIRAMLTSRWLDKIIPTLGRDEILIFVQRESQRLDAMPGQRTYRVKGGSAPIYDGGWICRVTAARRVRAEVGGEKVLVGEKHEIEILKNSMGPHLNELAWFYSSVGARDQAPLGLDFAREVREESLERGLAKYRNGKGYFVDGELVAANKVEYLTWLHAEYVDPETGDVLENWEALARRLDVGSVPE